MVAGIPLTSAQIAEARRLMSSGMKRKDVAKMLKISTTAVTKVCRDIERPYEHRGRKRMNRTQWLTSTPSFDSD